MGGTVIEAPLNYHLVKNSLAEANKWQYYTPTFEVLFKNVDVDRRFLP